MTPTRWRRLACAATLLGMAAVHAELPTETVGMAPLAPPDAYRLVLADPTIGHIADGRAYVIDGHNLGFLGMVGTGFAGSVTTSRDGKSLFVATTYLDRLQRGNRADVVEVYGTGDLVLQHEIAIPPKRTQGLPTRALLATTPDDRFLLVQNATPATSVTVVDLQARRPVAEIATPGCYGVIPWPGQARRFSSLCGDGTLVSFDLDEQGALARRLEPLRFFDPDQDPVFTHYDFVGDRLVLVSYLGQVHVLDLQGAQAAAQAPWPLADAAAARQGWRPGGYQLFAVEPRAQRLYVGMHRKGQEGSHKNPAEEIWVFDLASGRRLARMPGHAALGMEMARADPARLFVLSAQGNRVLSFDASRPPTSPRAARPLATSAPVGETPVYLRLP